MYHFRAARPDVRFCLASTTHLTRVSSHLTPMRARNPRHVLVCAAFSSPHWCGYDTTITPKTHRLLVFLTTISARLPTANVVRVTLAYCEYVVCVNVLAACETRSQLTHTLQDNSQDRRDQLAAPTAVCRYIKYLPSAFEELVARATAIRFVSSLLLLSLPLSQYAHTCPSQ